MFFKVLKSNNKVVAINDILSENLCDCDAEQVISKAMDFDTVKIRMQNDRLKYIAVPACSDKEVYFYETETEIIFSDNIYLVCDFVKNITENKGAVSFFLNKSYAPSGETLVEGVFRLISSRVYEIKGGRLDSKKIEYSSNLYSRNKTDYENFTLSLEKICKNAAYHGKVGVFFSGGVDSLTLALTLDKLNIPFTLYTGKMTQGLSDNEKDVLRSISIAKFKKWDLHIVPIDYNSYELDDLHEIIGLMPNTSHLSVLFLEIAKQMKKDDVKVCFSGQNLDILYNFEATASLGFSRGSIVNLVRRFFLSEIYFSNLYYEKKKNTAVELVARILLLGYCIMRKSFSYRLPKSKNELFYNFTHSSDNTVFTDTKTYTNEAEYKYKFEGDEGLRSALIRSRIEESLTSGAPLSIINAGKISNIKVVLPYSSELLIPFFMNLKDTTKDIFYPKKIIHEFVNKHINNLSKHDIEPKTELPNYHFWAENIFPDTKLGMSINRVKNNLCSKMPTSALKLSCNFSNNWKNHVINTIKDKKND
jgi:hypothetical protein